MQDRTGRKVDGVPGGNGRELDTSRGGDVSWGLGGPGAIADTHGPDRHSSFVFPHVPLSNPTPNIVDQLPKLEIKARPATYQRKLEPNGTFAQPKASHRWRSLPPPDIPLPADSASAPKPPTDIWLRPSFGMMAVLEPADGYPSKWTATSWTDKLDRIPIFPTRLRAVADTTATLARRVSNAVQGQSWLRRTGFGQYTSGRCSGV